MCRQQGCLTRPHPKQAATQSGQITMFTSPISTLKGHLNIPSTTWLASKPKNPALCRTHQQHFWLSFPSPQQGCAGTCQARLSVKEVKMEVDRESLLQPIMSVICPQIEARRDKEKPSDTTHLVESTFMSLCLCVCVISSNALQPSCLTEGLLDTRISSSPPSQLYSLAWTDVSTYTHMNTKIHADGCVM